MLRRVRPMIRYGGAVCIALGLAAGPTRAEAGTTASQIELVISAVADGDAYGAASVELRLLNSGSAPEAMALPPQIGAELTVNRSTSNISLERAPQTPAAVSVPAGGFTRARYILHLPISEEHTSDLQSLMRRSYAVFCLKQKHNSIS